MGSFLLEKKKEAKSFEVQPQAECETDTRSQWDPQSCYDSLSLEDNERTFSLPILDCEQEEWYKRALVLPFCLGHNDGLSLDV